MGSDKENFRHHGSRSFDFCHGNVSEMRLEEWKWHVVPKNMRLLQWCTTSRRRKDYLKQKRDFMPCFFHLSGDGVFDFRILVQIVENCFFAHLESNVGKFFANADDLDQIWHGSPHRGIGNVHHGFEFDIESSHGSPKLSCMQGALRTIFSNQMMRGQFFNAIIQFIYTKQTDDAQVSSKSSPCYLQDIVQFRTRTNAQGHRL